MNSIRTNPSSAPGRAFACTIFLAILAATGSAQEQEEIFRSANQDFEAGSYDQAALKYESLVEKGLLSADLFYNLGTTLYRLDRPGEAMLFLRRAQVLDPSLPEVRQNIEVLRNRVGILEFSDSDFDRFVRALPASTGHWVGSALLWIAAIAVAAGYAIPRLRPNRSGLITLAIVLAMVAFVAFRIDDYRATRLAPENFSIVVAPDAQALTAPAPDASPVIDLPPGSEVRTIQATGPWRYVDIPDDLRGWVRAETVVPVWPVPRSE